MQGDPSAMSEAQRYFIIPENTLLSWFAVAPLNDPCSIDQF